VALVGATNEIPDDEALRAFLDRFLVRCFVEPVGDEAFAALLGAHALESRVDALAADAPDGAADAASPVQLDVAELHAARVAASRVALPPAVLDTLAALRRQARDWNLQVSDRRWVRAVALLRMAAATAGRNE